MPGSDRYGLTPEFWSRFRERHWEKRPLVLRQPFVRPIATTAKIFRALVRCSASPGQASAGLRFYNEQARQEADLKKYLPAPHDHSLGNYVARIDRQLQGRRFGLIARNYQHFDAATWCRLRDFFAGCFEAVGMPLPWIDVSIFIGNYDRTPFGVHRDEHGTFLFVLEGTKRILTWPGRKFREHSRVNLSTVFERHRASAVTLEGEPGDVLYWPKTHWHVAESAGGLSVTLHVAIFPEMDSGRDLAQHVARLVETRLKSTNNRELYAVHPHALPKAAKNIDQISRMISTGLRELSNSPTLRNDLRIAWLKRLTSGGFQVVPPPAPRRRLSKSDRLRGDPKFPILCLRHKGEMICAASGHVFSVNAHPAWPKLIAHINRGRPFFLGEVANGALPLKDVRAFLEKLLSLRALRRETRRLTRSTRTKVAAI